MKQEPRSTGLGGMFSWLRRKVKTNRIERVASTRVVTNIQVTNPWHAVAVSVGSTCCRASAAARHTRYLSSEAPPLPLMGCSQPGSCTCKYKHYSDRRAGPRRVTDSELYKNALSPHVRPRFTMEERRLSRGRRIDDVR